MRGLLLLVLLLLFDPFAGGQNGFPFLLCYKSLPRFNALDLVSQRCRIPVNQSVFDSIIHNCVKRVQLPLHRPRLKSCPLLPDPFIHVANRHRIQRKLAEGRNKRTVHIALSDPKAFQCRPFPFQPLPRMGGKSRHLDSF